MLGPGNSKSLCAQTQASVPRSARDPQTHSTPLGSGGGDGQLGTRRLFVLSTTYWLYSEKQPQRSGHKGHPIHRAALGQRDKLQERCPGLFWLRWAVQRSVDQVRRWDFCKLLKQSPLGEGSRPRGQEVGDGRKMQNLHLGGWVLCASPPTRGCY